MFVYLFVWETLGIPETPAGDHRETTGRPQGDHREINELKSKLVHMSLIETHQQETSRSTREKLDVIIHKLSGILLTLFIWCVMYLRIIFK